MARWFSRVWTFQGGLACHEVYGIEAPVTGILASVVAELMESLKQDYTIHHLVTTSLIQHVHSTRDIHRATSHAPKRAKLYEQLCARVPCCCCSVKCSGFYTEEDRHNVHERGVCMQQMHFHSHLYSLEQVLLISRWAVLIICTTHAKEASIAFESLYAVFNFGFSCQAERSLEVIEILEKV